ncbi:TadE/TadG family type IV pilus assembly protein [Tropicibacter naphthalenivorans]|uniref:Flp pilus assembly protein TadG n=1 Tax=Tropicibacter naphthalenivorans TaxID=441103 RepID=A0A0P1G8L9_9RHOB|nr:TadE/TadG family type IV pilus assembly protein [Tropicibacter naphthalenivorans]CUH77868.1 Flp pilus assembly protein TadG [Tropicibacter naphthalenivorans]SMC95337.1 Flp pilus assembly protein TadG [Tropicibacter naphthalenivorans]
MRLSRQDITRFAREEDGNVTIFSVFSVMTILTITGAAVDLMRSEAARVKMQATVDRAVLAAADLDQMQAPDTVVRDYVAKSGLAEMLTNVSIETGVNDRVVSATTEGMLETLFLRLAGHDTLTQGALATAEERIANVEVSLVLDISGSMRYNQRMERLKPAAKAFVDKVLTERSQGVTTLNLVPFAGQVNPGDIMFDYFRGERPKLKQNNGWGNGDQDAPGNSLCNNNAENADEGAADPSCADGTATVDNSFFPVWPQAISNVVMYFDTDGDDIFDRAHKIEGFPEDAPRDLDDIMAGAAAYAVNYDPSLYSTTQLLGFSIKGGQEKTRYFTVRGNTNGPASELGPTKNNGKIPGLTFQYPWINYAYWEASYVAQPEVADEQNVNMPSSCIEVYDDEFWTTALPLSDDFVPHFNFWPTDETVMDWGWCPEDDSAIQYYSSDAAQLKTFIDGLRMHDGTGIHIALKYALALLDPMTREAVGHLIDADLVAPEYLGRPIDWHDGETEKYIVLMTDGQITDQYRPVDPDAAINGEVDLQTQGPGSYTVLSDQATNTQQLFRQCDLARQNGVVVFTIAFETNQAAADDMRACASSDSHFFHVQGTEIAEAFDSIARQINNLRLIQ